MLLDSWCAPLLQVLLADLGRASNWWFSIGFVGIGLNTKLDTMYAKLQGGSVLLLYWVGQSINVRLAPPVFSPFCFLRCILWHVLPRVLGVRESRAAQERGVRNK